MRRLHGVIGQTLCAGSNRHHYARCSPRFGSNGTATLEPLNLHGRLAGEAELEARCRSRRWTTLAEGLNGRPATVEGYKSGQ